MKRFCLSILLLAMLGVSANADPQEWVTSDKKSFDCGKTIKIAAEPKTGFTFSQWDDGNTDNPRTILVGEKQTFTALFTISTATDMDNTNANDPHVRKVLINDHIFIIRNDKTYSIQGELVR